MPAHSLYSEELAQQICDLVAAGKEMKEIGEMDGMPGVRTIYVWLRKYESFRVSMDVARMEAADAHASKVMELADQITKETWSATRERIEAHKWRARILNPGKYSERMRIEHDDLTAKPMRELVESTRDLMQSLGMTVPPQLLDITDPDADAR